MLAREIRRDPTDYELTGFADDEPNRRRAGPSGSVHHPGRLVGLDQADTDLPETIRELNPDAVVITTFRHASAIRGRFSTLVPVGVEVIEL